VAGVQEESTRRAVLRVTAKAVVKRRRGAMEDVASVAPGSPREAREGRGMLLALDRETSKSFTRSTTVLAAKVPPAPSSPVAFEEDTVGSQRP
jgi:hypothetical protein